MKRRTIFYLLIACAVLTGAILACAGTLDNLRVSDLPQYVCPSATPRLTDTPRPTSSPTYPYTFVANLDYNYVDVTRSVVMAQYLAQGVGNVQLTYSGVTAGGQLWAGSFNIGNAPYGSPGVIGSYPLFIPSDVSSATVSVTGGYSYSFVVTRYPYPLTASPNPSPCCLPSPIYPTPVPTYTPYPTPTPYVRTNDYFLGDPVYALTATLRIRFRVTDMAALSTPQGTVYVWRLEVKNVGSVEYDLYPAVQMYLSEIVTAGGGTVNGVWGPSLGAAQAAGMTPTYDPVALAPGQTQMFVLAAFGPAGTVSRVSYAMDSTARGGGPTQVPGANIVSWLNRANTECKGEIREPR